MIRVNVFSCPPSVLFGAGQERGHINLGDPSSTLHMAIY